jgi:hypothetical protein
MRRISALSLALLISAATHADEEPAGEFSEKSARNSSRDVKIPQGLVQNLEAEYRAFLAKNEVSLKENIKRKMLNMSVELTQNRPIALHEDTRIVTPLGGGVIDLSEYVTPLKGAFALKINAKKEDGTEPSGLRVFFVSHGKARLIDGDEFGAGCDKYMEITRYFHRKHGGKGFELYTAGQRYLSVVGGTFVAVVFEKEALQVGSLTFTDSRYPEHLCE